MGPNTIWLNIGVITRYPPRQQLARNIKNKYPYLDVKTVNRIVPKTVSTKKILRIIENL